MKAMREAYGEALVELGRMNPDVVVLDADVAGSSRSALFGQAFPDRFYNVGIAEGNMVGIAAGMATAGKIPFVNTFAFLMALALLGVGIFEGHRQVMYSVLWGNVFLSGWNFFSASCSCCIFPSKNSRRNLR